MKRILLLTLIVWASVANAYEFSDSGKITFRQALHNLELDLSDNRRVMNRFFERLNDRDHDSIAVLERVVIEGGASPEGGIAYNRALSQRRANTLFRYLQANTDLPDSLMEFRFLGRDWEGLALLCEADSAMPYNIETAAYIRNLAAEAAKGDISAGDQTARMKLYRGGKPWRYMYANLFPYIRASRVILQYRMEKNPYHVSVIAPPPGIYQWPEPTFEPPVLVFPHVAPKLCRPFYMGVRTNMIFDALLVPNIGVQFYLGKNFTIGADWAYAWWSTDRTHHYWRLYGGDIVARYWFGKAAAEKPLTGHHVGIYGQIFTYDIELGGKGYMGGKPGGTLWDRMHWGAGVEYGYTLPIARRLNIDFSIGFGYAGGRYYEYVPKDGCYVWQATKQRHWVGPTKADISLVWLVGCGNYNRKFAKKGGLL